MLVKDIMKKDLITVKRSMNLKELIRRLQDFHSFPLVLVVDDDNLLKGIISFHNLIDIIQPLESIGLKTIPFLERDEIDIFDLEITPEMGILILVDDMMEINVLTIDEEDSLEKAYSLMQRHSIDRLPVIDKDHRLKGMIGVFDILVALFRQQGIIE